MEVKSQEEENKTKQQKEEEKNRRVREQGELAVRCMGTPTILFSRN